MRDLRAAVIGYGQMGRHHARVLSELPGVELVGVVEPAPPERSWVPFVPDLETLLAGGLDLAIVAVPTALHEAIALQLAEAGVHALIEKPVAADVAASQRMADAFEAAGLVGCVGHIERYNPAIRELRRRVSYGELGEVYQIATRRQGPYPERIADVGVILDLATHDIDLTSWVSGRRYETVFARIASRSGRHHEDLVAAVGSLSDGTVVSHLVNWLSPFKERVTVVAGERGCFVADTLTADLTFHANGIAPVAWDTLASFRGVVAGDVTRFAIAKREPLVMELSAFRDAAAGLEAEVVSIREAADVVAVAAHLLEAARGEQADGPPVIP